MSINFLIIIGSLLIFSLLIYSLVISCDKKIESWVNYQNIPYGNIDTGAGDLEGDNKISFYEYTSYRKPLNYPVCHLVDYPVPHCRADSL